MHLATWAACDVICLIVRSICRLTSSVDSGRHSLTCVDQSGCPERKPRSYIMLKIISSAVLAGSFALTVCHDASACGGGLCCRKRTCVSKPAAACAAPAAAPAAPAAAPPVEDVPPSPPAPETAQNGRQRYRSFSYDPAPAPVPAYRAPMMRSYSRAESSSQGNQYRANRKMFGLQ